MTKKGRDRFYVSEKYDPLFKKLIQEDDSSLKGRTNTEVFLLAMATGYDLEKRVPLGKKDQGGFTRFSYLTDEQFAIVKAIAIAEKGSLDVLLNMEEVCNIAEEYANAGIGFLYKDVLEEKKADFTKKLEATTVQKIKAE